MKKNFSKYDAVSMNRIYLFIEYILVGCLKSKFEFFFKYDAVNMNRIYLFYFTLFFYFLE